MKTRSHWLTPGALVLAGAFLAAPALQAQDPQKPVDVDEVRAYVEMLRSDVNTSKIRTLNQVMRLTAAEAEIFWPIYREYETELAAVGDRKLALVREFAALHFGGTLDDKQANDLASRWLQNNQDRLDLWKKYHQRLGKALSPIRAAQFLQVEHQMALFVDLNIAAEMPAVGSKPPARP